MGCCGSKPSDDSEQIKKDISTSTNEPNEHAANDPGLDDSGEALLSGANDIAVVKQADGTFQATNLEVKVGKMTNFSTMVSSREGRKARLEVNNSLVLTDTTIEIGDSGDAFILRPERSLTFTSQELKDMNLKDGINEAFFVNEDLCLRIPFSIHLLNQDNRLVFTDVDGTITTSDAEGFIGGELGLDSHHEGAVELFEKVGKNGYTLIYLSARPMALNEHTRKYLFEQLRPNDKGFSLPISPLFVSNIVLLEGVSEAGDPSARKCATIRCVVEMFDLKEKIVCAAYGNKDTDAKAYVDSGIEKNKIFIVDKNNCMVNYGTGDETSYKNHVENFDTIYPK